MRRGQCLKATITAKLSQERSFQGTQCPRSEFFVQMMRFALLHRILLKKNEKAAVRAAGTELDVAHRELMKAAHTIQIPWVRGSTLGWHCLTQPPKVAQLLHPGGYNWGRSE